MHLTRVVEDRYGSAPYAECCTCDWRSDPQESHTDAFASGREHEMSPVVGLMKALEDAVAAAKADRAKCRSGEVEFCDGCLTAGCPVCWTEGRHEGEDEKPEYDTDGWRRV